MLNVRRQCLEFRDGSIACLFKPLYEQYVVEYNPFSSLTSLAEPQVGYSFNATSALLPHSTADASLWHARLGHASTAAIKHLTVAAEGVSLPPCRHSMASDKCETCLLAKSKRMISRRSIPPATNPWEKVYFDFFSMQPTAYNGDRSCLHFICSATGWHVAQTMPNKDQIRLVRAVNGLVHWAKAQFDVSIKAFFSDNDTALGMDFQFLSEDLGFEVLRSPRYADSQHGKPERAGGVIMSRMRSMLLVARLSQSLWPLAVQSATYLINRTPAWIKTADADGTHTWTTPYERMLKEKPNLANLRVFGCRAYVRDAKVPKGNKVRSRAWIGYMVGYQAANIWQIWNPRHQEVVKERDIVFNESLFYDPDLPLPQDVPVQLPDPQPFQSIQLPPAVLEADDEVANSTVQDMIDDGQLPSMASAPTFKDNESEQQNKDDPQYAPISPEHTPVRQSPPMEQPGEGSASPTHGQHSPQIPGAFGDEDSAPATPDSTHMDAFFLPSGDTGDSPNLQDDGGLDPSSQQLSAELNSQPEPLVCSNSSLSAAGGENAENSAHNFSQNTAARAGEISADFNPSLVVTGKRKRRARHLFAIFQGFSLSMQKALNPLISKEPSPGIEPSRRIHRNDLPAPPGNYREMARRPMHQWFRDAMELELSTLESKGTWSIGRRPKNAFIIPTIWVYTYNFDDKGFLKRANARLCVQRNQQVMTHEETRAATLALSEYRDFLGPLHL